MKLSALCALGALVFLFGCGGGGSGSPNTDPEIYFINGSADAGDVDFRMDDSPAATSLDYLQSSNDFIRFDYHGPDVEGWDVSLNLTGGAEIERQAIVFPHDSDALVIAHGMLNYPAGELTKRLRFTAISADRDAITGAKARLIIFHGFEREAGKETPNIDFKNPTDNPLNNAPNIAPGGTSTILVDSGTQDWEVRRTGAFGIFASKTQTLDPGGIYLVLISGVENSATPGDEVTINFIKLTAQL